MTRGLFHLLTGSSGSPARALCALALTLGLACPAAAETRTKLGEFKTTYYWVTSESAFTGPRDTPIYNMAGKTLGTFRAKFVKALTLEGTGRSLEGTVYNWAGRRGGQSRFMVVKHPYGIGSRNNPLVPFRSVATDPKVIPWGTILFIPKAVGATLPDGTKHDGYFHAADTGGAIKGYHLDLFTGLGDQRAVLTRNGLANLKKHEVFKVTGSKPRPELTTPKARPGDGEGKDNDKGKTSDRDKTGKTGRDSGAKAPGRADLGRPSASGPTAPAGETINAQVRITASSLNVRRGPGTEFKIISVLHKNDRVTAIARAKGWYKVRFSGVVGWVSGRYAELVREQRRAATIGRVTATMLNVRAGPSTRYGKVGTVRKGQRLTVLESRSGWHRVDLGRGRSGWVSGRYLSVSTDLGGSLR